MINDYLIICNMFIAASLITSDNSSKIIANVLAVLWLIVGVVT